MNRLPRGKLSEAWTPWRVPFTPGLCLLLVALVGLVFGQSLGFGFANVDDADYVTKNPAVTHGLTVHGFIWAFTHFHAANWHPLTWISHMLDCQIYGLRPRGHHLTNLLLHSATAVTLFLTLRAMTRALWPSAFVAAVFAVHPLRAESVVWIAERKDLLSGFFFALTLLAYLRYTRRPGRGNYLLVLATFVAGLLSKPMLVTLPAVLLLLDYWPLERFGKEKSARLFLEKLPMFLCGLALGVVTLFAQHDAIMDIASVPMAVRLGNAVVSCWIYLRQTIWPVGLAPFYPFPPAGISIPQLIISSLALGAISAAVFRFHSRKYLVTGWLWFLIMLGPVIGIIQVGEQSHADRYTYLPQLGLLIALTWACADLTSRWPRARFVAGPLAAVVLAGLIVQARTQTGYWRNSEVLWRHALSVTPDNRVARRNLGQALQEDGKTDDAVENYRRALVFETRQPPVLTNLGAILLEKGDPHGAMEYFHAALQIQPKYAEAESNLGLALSDLGQNEESLAHFQRALAIDPDFADAHYNLGNSFLALGRLAEAVAEYKSALELNPNDERALNNLAWILATAPQPNIRDGGAAVRYASRADEFMQKKNPVIAATLAATLAEQGHFPEAIEAAQRAAALATSAGNAALANSIRRQRQSYEAGAPFRDPRFSAPSR
ncbi:MAG: tetratricopeptide repeat protein [Chthoniobacterales bacterium]